MAGCLTIGVVGVAHVDMQGLRVRFLVYVNLSGENYCSL